MGIGEHRRRVSSEHGRIHGKVDKARPAQGDVGQQAGAIERGHDRLGDLPRRLAQFFGQRHGQVGLKIAVLRVVGRADQRVDGRVIIAKGRNGGVAEPGLEGGLKVGHGRACYQGPACQRGPRGRHRG